MLQLVYISSVTKGAAVGDILSVSQRNNARVGVTGLLYADGVRFLQALEGEEADVMATFDRIAPDPRHRALVVLSRRTVSVREFGTWAMAKLDADRDPTAFVDRVSQLLTAASPNIRATFEGFMKIRLAA